MHQCYISDYLMKESTNFSSTDFSARNTTPFNIGLSPLLTSTRPQSKADMSTPFGTIPNNNGKSDDWKTIRPPVAKQRYHLPLLQQQASPLMKVENHQSRSMRERSSAGPGGNNKENIHVHQQYSQTPTPSSCHNFLNQAGHSTITPSDTTVASTMPKDKLLKELNKCITLYLTHSTRPISLEASSDQRIQVSRSAGLDFFLRIRNQHQRKFEEGMELCAFCRNNNQPFKFYITHKVKDIFGRVTCPILRRYVCPLCGSHGDYAHTMKYCPLSAANVD